MSQASRQKTNTERSGRYLLAILLVTTMNVPTAQAAWWSKLNPFKKPAQQSDNILATGVQSGARALRAQDALADSTAGLLTDIAHQVKAPNYVPTIGVEADTLKIIGKLASPDDIAVFITGPKGVGKSQFLYAIQERIIAMQQKLAGNVSASLKHLENRGLPKTLQDARIIKIDSGHKFMNDADAFEGIIRQAEAQLGKTDETLVFHFDSVERFLKDDHNKGVLELVDFTNRVKQRFGVDRVKFIIESSPAERDLLRNSHKFFADVQDVPIRPRTIEETTQILRAHIPRITRTENVAISDETLRRAAVLAERYHGELGLPNGAVKLISAAIGNRLAYIEDGSLPIIEALQQQIKNIDTELKEVEKLSGAFAKQLQEQLPTDRSAVTTILEETKRKYEPLFNIRQDRESLLKEVQAAGNPTPAHLTDKVNELEKRIYSLTEEDLALTIHLDKGINLDSLLARAGAMTREAREEMYFAKIKGQPHIVKALVDAVDNLDSPFRDRTRPIVIMALGPTGSGKTFTWKTAVDIDFDGAGFRVDMGNFIDEHSVSGLTGAAPGLIGSDKGGVLTNPALIKKRQFGLLDEADKAHRKVWDVTLPMFDEGQLADSMGNIADYRDTILMVTMNFGQDIPANASLKEITDIFVANGFRPEWVNRFDDIIVYNPMTDNALGGILDSMIREINKQIRTELVMNIRMTAAASEQLVKKLEGGLNSGRDVRRTVQKEIRKRLTDAHKYGRYLDDAGTPHDLRITRGDEVVVDYKEGAGIVLRTAQ